MIAIYNETGIFHMYSIFFNNFHPKKKYYRSMY